MNNGLSCRMGGDEFAIAIFNIATFNDLNAIFNSISIAIQANKGFDLSVGSASTLDDIKTFDELYVAADKALYKAKEKGRNQFCMYEE